MKKVKLEIRFSGYYNEKQQSFDGGLVEILEHIKGKKLKNAIVRLDVGKKNEITWEEEAVFCPELSIKNIGYKIIEGTFKKFIANVECSPLSAKSLIKVLVKMAELGNGGHSYSILINDDSFGFDGDGSDHISSINGIDMCREIYSNTYKQSEIYTKGLEGEESSEMNESISPIKITNEDIKQMVAETIKKLSQKDIL
jgi:hypothetical protein